MEEPYNTTMAKLHADLRGIIALLGDRMYSGDPIVTSIKELLQNSYDAIKMEAKNTPNLQGYIEIITNKDNRTITVQDNGCGMTKEVVESAFFGIGCSHKEGLSTEERSGGFGAAKVQFLTFPEKIQLCTVKDGIMTHCTVTREQLLDGEEFTLTQEETTHKNGTKVVLYIGKKTMKGEYFDLYFPSVSTIKSYLPIGQLTVRYVCDDYWRTDNTINCNNLFEMPFVGTAEACFGKIDIYMGNLNSSKGSQRVKVYSAGIKQFEQWYGSYDNRFAPLIINVRPCVDAHNELYPINNQRQGWSSKVKPEINDLFFFIEKICNTLEAKKVQRLFSASTSTMVGAKASAIYNEIDERNEIISNAWANFSTEDKPVVAAISSKPQPTLSLRKISETRKAENDIHRSSTFKGFEVAFEEIKVDTTDMSLDTAVIYNNTNLDLTPYNEFIEKFGAMLIQFRDLVHSNYPTLAPSDQFWGIALDKSFLGVRVKPSLFNFIGINPFGFKFEYVDGVNYVDAITEQTIHIILHELTHNSYGNHGDQFCAELCANYGAICGLPWFNSWKANLKDLVATYAVNIAEGSKAYKEATNIDTTILEEA